MFICGGSLCAPDVRHAAVPDVDPSCWPREIDRALVLGGCTDWLVDELSRRGCGITVVEAATHMEQARVRWAARVTVRQLDGVEGLVDLGPDRYDAVFLLGGTQYTGGPFRGNADWAAAGPAWLAHARELISGRGEMIVDGPPPTDAAVRGVALGTSTEGGVSYVEASIVPEDNLRRLVLRTSDCAADGVVATESVESFPWVVGILAPGPLPEMSQTHG